MQVVSNDTLGRAFQTGLYCSCKAGYKISTILKKTIKHVKWRMASLFKNFGARTAVLFPPVIFLTLKIAHFRTHIYTLWESYYMPWRMLETKPTKVYSKKNFVKTSEVHIQ